MNKAPLSTEYPKWLYAKGQRDLMIKSAEEENEARGRGYSHVIPKEDPIPVPGSAAALAPPGTVSTATVDSLLEHQKETLSAKFDRAWAGKCEELKALHESHTELKATHDKLTADHMVLVDEHATALAKIDSLSADKAEDAKSEPVKPPVAGKKGSA